MMSKVAFEAVPIIFSSRPCHVNQKSMLHSQIFF